MAKINYIGFARTGSVYGPAHGEGEYVSSLPAGHYKVDYDHYGDRLTLTSFVPRLDEILNLGCAEFNNAINLTEKFMQASTAKTFADKGFLLKRSFMFYGPPGTGKSVLAAKISDLSVQHKNALVLYPTGEDALSRILEVLDSLDSDRFKTIVLEEFDALIRRDEETWTTLLDGQFQSNNRILLATTNTINRIPKRLLRPGRFASIIHIPALTSTARDNFLKMKDISSAMRAEIVEKTKGFTVDDLKEVVQRGVLLGESIDSVVTSIKDAKELGGESDE